MFARSFAALAMIAGPAALAAAETLVVDFEDLTLPPDSFDNGRPADPDPGVTYDGTFTSGGATFNNSFTDFGGFESWSGWSYSNRGSTITGGVPASSFFDFQYHSTTGGDATTGSGIFGVAFAPSPDAAYIDLPDVAGPVTGMSVKITNTTYAVLSMLNGDQFAKRFGGPTGDDPDFFELTITGYEGAGASGPAVGSVPFALADYRFDDDSLDFVVRDWRSVDLSGLAGARSLGFALASSDNDPVFGMNTPAYFALDDLAISFAAIPEPSSLALASFGLVMAAAASSRARRRR